MKNRVRYFIVLFLFFISSLNYADRNTLAIVNSDLSRDLGLNSVWMGNLFTAWALSYVIAQLPVGWLLDRYGSKRIYGLGLFLWSLMVVLMGFTSYLSSKAAYLVLYGLLFLTGFALAPAFPGNGRLVAAWFPTRERGLASAVFNSSQYFSLVLFAPLMGWIVHECGWRYVFWTMGALGILLTPLWFLTVYSPREHPNVTQTELQHIETGGGLVNMDMGGKAGARFNLKWTHIKQLLGNRMLIGVYLGQFCIATITYFFLQWFPNYLEHRGMSIVKAGILVAPTALCGCVGGILGGRVSDALLQRGCSLTFARKAPIVFGMLLSCVMILCNFVHANWLVVLIMCLAFFGKGIGALGWTVVSDTSPSEIVGLSGGLFNMFGNTAAITTGFIIGFLIKQTGSFAAGLVYVGANALGAIFCYLVIVGEIKRLELISPQSTACGPRSAVRSGET